MSRETKYKAGARTQPKNAADIMREYGIRIVPTTLGDGSVVWDVKIHEEIGFNCTSESNAESLAFAFAVAIRNYAII